MSNQAKKNQLKETINLVYKKLDKLKEDPYLQEIEFINLTELKKPSNAEIKRKFKQYLDKGVTASIARLDARLYVYVQYLLDGRRLAHNYKVLMEMKESQLRRKMKKYKIKYEDDMDKDDMADEITRYLYVRSAKKRHKDFLEAPEDDSDSEESEDESEDEPEVDEEESDEKEPPKLTPVVDSESEDDTEPASEPEHDLDEKHASTSEDEDDGDEDDEEDALDRERVEKIIKELQKGNKQGLESMDAVNQLIVRCLGLES